MSKPIRFDITARDKTRNAFLGVQSQLKTTQRGVGLLTRAMGPLIGAFGAYQLGRGLINTNKEFQSLRATLVTFTGSAAKGQQAFAALTKFAASTPFAVKEVTEAYNTLVSRGITPSIEMLSKFGDIAAGSGKSLTQFAQAVANAATGEMEMLKQFGVTARVEGDKLRVGFAGNSKLIERDAKSIVTELENIAKTGFAGATEKQAATLSGAFSNLGDSVDMFAFAIGEAGLNKEINRVARSLGEWITKNRDVTKQISGALVSGIRALETGVKFVAENFKILAAAAASFVAIKAASAAFVLMSAMFSLGKMIFFAKKAQDALNFSISKSPMRAIAKVLIGVVAGYAAYQVIAKKSEKQTKALQDEVDDLTENGLPDLERGTGKATGGVKKLTEAEKEWASITKSLLRPSEKYIRKLAAISKLQKDGTATAIQQNNAIKATARQYYGITRAASELETKIEDLNYDMKSGIVTQKEGTAKLGEYRLELLKVKAAQDKTYGSGAKLAVAEYFDGLKDKASIMSNFMASSVFQPMEKALSSFYRTGKLDFGSFKDAVLDGLADMAAKATMSFAGSVATSIASGLGSTVGGFIGNNAGSIWTTISSWFASGGPVSGPGTGTSDSIPARLSNGEYVIQASAARRLGASRLNMMNQGIIPGFASGGAVDGIGGTNTDFGLSSGVDGIGGSNAAFGIGQGSPTGIGNHSLADFMHPSTSGNVMMQHGKSLMSEFGKTLADMFGISTGSGSGTGVQGLTDAQINAIAKSTGDQSAIALNAQQQFDGVIGALLSFTPIGIAAQVGMALAAMFGNNGPGELMSDANVANHDGNSKKISGPTWASAAAFAGVIPGALAGPMNDNFSNLITNVDGIMATPRPRANGGPTMPGRPYLVGENGPEVMNPGAGRISPLTSSDPSGSKSIVTELKALRTDFQRMERALSRQASGQRAAGVRAA